MFLSFLNELMPQPKHYQKTLTKEYILTLCGTFYHGYGSYFYVETNQGNFIYSDPTLGGENTIIQYTSGTYKDWHYSPPKSQEYRLISERCGDQWEYVL